MRDERRPGGRAGGVVACARATSGRRHRLRRRGLHEPVAGPPGLPREHGGVLRREGATVHARACSSGGGERRRPVGAPARSRTSRSPRRRTGSTRTPTCGPTTSASPRTGVAFTVGGLEIRSRLRGAFNVENCLAAVGVAAGARHRRRGDRARGSPTLGDVPGRMEPVEAGQDFLVVVDYAHTPDSIRSVLRASRPLTSGRLIVVFGCGGDRDRAKRSPMGAAATADADLTDRHHRQPPLRGSAGDHRRDRTRREGRRRRVHGRARPANRDPDGAAAAAPGDVVVDRRQGS